MGSYQLEEIIFCPLYSSHTLFDVGKQFPKEQLALRACPMLLFADGSAEVNKVAADPTTPPSVKDLCLQEADRRLRWLQLCSRPVLCLNICQGTDPHELWAVNT